MLVDVVLLVVLAIFVFRKSRVASTILVLYFIANKLLMWMELGKARSLPSAIPCSLPRRRTR